MSHRIQWISFFPRDVDQSGILLISIENFKLTQKVRKTTVNASLPSKER